MIVECERHFGAIRVLQGPGVSAMDVCALTLTFGECAENHEGNKQIGTMAANGFTVGELRAAAKKFESRGRETELVDIAAEVPEGDEAVVLVIKGGVEAFDVGAKEMFDEHDKLTVDKKAIMRGRVRNKIARHNLCYDDVAQEAKYEIGQGTVVAFETVPLLNAVRKNLSTFFGPKADNLKCELNKYYDKEKTGIGFHGDAERKRVIAIRLGATIPLVFQWYKRSKVVGAQKTILLRSGDMYVMSEKATGHDWKKRSLLTVRHAAGCKKYTTIKQLRDLPACSQCNRPQCTAPANHVSCFESRVRTSSPAAVAPMV